MKNKLVIPALTLAVAAMVIFGMPSQAHANWQGDNSQTLIEKIVAKFGLKQADVESVFKEHRTEMQAKHVANNEARLTQLVKDGKLTEAQKQLILAKQKEHQAEREADKEKVKDMTQEQRRAFMENERKEMETWAAQNKIDLQYLMNGKMGRGGMHMMK